MDEPPPSALTPPVRSGAPGSSVEQRLAGLLRATQAVVGDLSLPVVLQRLVDSARDLVGAQHAALGILGPDRTLSDLTVSGTPDDPRNAVDPAHFGLGIPDHADTPGGGPSGGGPSGGGPSGGGPSDTGARARGAFLGVPIRIRDATFGMLYLTERVGGGSFTDEDEQLASALAATAATAIQNARLYEHVRRRERSLQVSVEITRSLLLGRDDPLRLITSRAQEATDADMVALAVPAATGYRLEAVIGPDAVQLGGTAFPAAQSLTQQAIERGRSLRLDDVDAVPGHANPMGYARAVIVPVIEHSSARGALVLARKAGRPAFSVDDVDSAEAFGDLVGLALSLADAQGDRERLTLLEERTRIARDLHDHVIQRLFATGLGLQRFADRAVGADAERMSQHITDLDDTIRQIRQTIFRLQAGDRLISTRSRIIDVADQTAPLLGFAPVVLVSHDIDGLLTPTLADDVVACVREGLSNIVRHAHATSARVTLLVEDDPPGGGPPMVVLDIIDDGVGMTDTSRRSGLANMEARARRGGGDVQLSRSAAGGLHLRWRVKMPDRSAS